MKERIIFMLYLIIACYSWCIAVALSFIWIMPTEKNINFIVWTGIIAWFVIALYSLYKVWYYGKGR